MTSGGAYCTLICEVGGGELRGEELGSSVAFSGPALSPATATSVPILSLTASSRGRAGRAGSSSGMAGDSPGSIGSSSGIEGDSSRAVDSSPGTTEGFSGANDGSSKAANGSRMGSPVSETASPLSLIGSSITGSSIACSCRSSPATAASTSQSTSHSPSKSKTLEIEILSRHFWTIGRTFRRPSGSSTAWLTSASRNLGSRTVVGSVVTMVALDVSLVASKLATVWRPICGPPVSAKQNIHPFL